MNYSELFQLTELGTEAYNPVIEAPVQVWATQARRLYEKREGITQLDPNYETEWKVNLMCLLREQKLAVMKYIQGRMQFYASRKTEAETDLLGLMKDLEEQRNKLGGTFECNEMLKISLEELIEIYKRKVEVWTGTVLYFEQEF